MARLDDRSSDEPMRWPLTRGWRDWLDRLAELCISMAAPLVIVLVTVLLLRSYCR